MELYPPSEDESGFCDYVAGLGDKQFEQYVKECSKSRLIKMLRVLEIRLGTDGERSTDLFRVQAIAHRLNNMVAVERLLRDLPADRH